MGFQEIVGEISMRVNYLLVPGIVRSDSIDVMNYAIDAFEELRLINEDRRAEIALILYLCEEKAKSNGAIITKH